MKKIFTMIIGLCILCFAATAYALDGVEVFTGYLQGGLKEPQDDYEGIPLLVALNFDVKPIFAKIGIEAKGRLNFVVEPFVNTILSPDSNVEVGSNFLVKYVFPLSDKFQPYLKGGLGVLYMSQHTREQGSQYNFLPQAGAGFHYFIKDKVALSCEYRYRHLSNNSFDEPNGGIDVNMALAGLSFFFE